MVEAFGFGIHPRDLIKFALFSIKISHIGDVDRHCALCSQGLDFSGPSIAQEIIIEVSLVVVGVVGHEGDGERR